MRSVCHSSTVAEPVSSHHRVEARRKHRRSFDCIDRRLRTSAKFQVERTLPGTDFENLPASPDSETIEQGV